MFIKIPLPSTTSRINVKNKKIINMKTTSTVVLLGQPANHLTANKNKKFNWATFYDLIYTLCKFHQSTNESKVLSSLPQLIIDFWVINNLVNLT